MNEQAQDSTAQWATTPPWTRLPCSKCGDIVLVTRSLSASIDHKNFRCEMCESYRRGYRDAEAGLKGKLIVDREKAEALLDHWTDPEVRDSVTYGEAAAEVRDLLGLPTPKEDEG